MSEISSPKDPILSEEIRQKFDCLINGFNKNNINLQTPLSKYHIENYLNKRATSKNQFNPVLLNKLLEQLNLNEDNKTVTLEYFVKYFVQFESDLNSQINNFTDIYNKNTDENDKNDGISIDELLNAMNNALGNTQTEAGIKHIFDLVKEDPNDKTITLEYFVKYFLQFETDLNSQRDHFTEQYNKTKEEYNKINDECQKYKNEKINEEGFCDNAKISIIIENIDLKNKIEGIKNLFIKIVYNNEIKQIEFEIEKNYELNTKLEL